MLAEAPFDGLRQYVNVHRVDVPSNESGTDDVCEGEYVDTAFDTGFNPTGIDCRLLWSANTPAIYAAAAAAPDVDTVAVLVNTDRYGGAATPGGVAFTTTGGAGEQVFVHEFGHSFGLLGDEYSGVGVAPDYLASFPNLTIDLAAGLDWADWVHPATPIPTAAPINGVVGAYQGGGGWGHRGVSPHVRFEDALAVSPVRSGQRRVARPAAADVRARRHHAAGGRGGGHLAQRHPGRPPRHLRRPRERGRWCGRVVVGRPSRTPHSSLPTS